MRILAVVVTFNGAKWIDKCVRSIVNSSLKPDIVCIDNNSKDNTVAIIEEKHPCVHVIKSGLNLGFGKANNIGLEIALKEKYDFCFLLNQDAWVELNTIEQMILLHKNNQEYGILAPLQLNGDGSLIDKLFLQYSVTPCRELLTDVLISNFKKDIYSISFANAACWLLPRKTIESIGGFDPLFPHYGEDNDYTNRVKAKNISIGICPNLKVYHDREYRTPERNIDKQVNYAYIRHLADLKNSRTILNSKTYFYKKYIFNAINRLFGNNKEHYGIQCKAIKKIIANYNLIVQHRLNEQCEEIHYLQNT